MGAHKSKVFLLLYFYIMPFFAIPLACVADVEKY